MVRSVRGGLWSTAGFGLVLLVLAFTDGRVRSRFATAFADPVEGGLTIGAKIGDLAGIIGVAAREQIATNSALVIFGVVAVLLVLFMVRS